MKRMFAVLLLLMTSLFGSDVSAVRALQHFDGDLWNSTLALYGTQGETTHFLCTAEVIGESKLPLENAHPMYKYRILSAGHCVQLPPAGLQFSVSDNIGTPRTNVTLVKAFMDKDIDMALFEYVSAKRYPVMQLGDSSDLRIGETTIDINFAAGVGKQMSLGKISSDVLPLSDNCSDSCSGYFLTQMYAAGGASGSAVISARTHKIIGLAIWMDPSGNIGVGTEPISKFAVFMAGPNQPHPSANDEADDRN